MGEGARAQHRIEEVVRPRSVALAAIPPSLCPGTPRAAPGTRPPARARARRRHHARVFGARRAAQRCARLAGRSITWQVWRLTACHYRPICEGLEELDAFLAVVVPAMR